MEREAWSGAPGWRVASWASHVKGVWQIRGGKRSGRLGPYKQFPSASGNKRKNVQDVKLLDEEKVMWVVVTSTLQDKKENYLQHQIICLLYK